MTVVAMARRRSEPRVFFPWERKKGFLGALARARVRQVLVVVAVVAAIVLLRRREERAASVRATRTSITNAERAVSAYRADHAGSCPKNLAELVAAGYTHEPPIDAWGRPLRLVCPGRKDPLGFDLSSDGPDGQPGGLDRVE
jgi:general secretion pathway protein G